MNIMINLLDPVVNTYQLADDIQKRLTVYLVQENMMQDVINQLFDSSQNRYKSEYQWKTAQAIELSKIILQSMNEPEPKFAKEDERKLNKLLGEFEPGKIFKEDTKKSLTKIASKFHLLTATKIIIPPKKQVIYQESVNYQQLVSCDVDNLKKLKQCNQYLDTEVSVILEKKDRPMKSQARKSILQKKIFVQDGSPRSFLHPSTPEMLSPQKQPSTPSTSDMTYNIYIGRSQRKKVSHFTSKLSKSDGHVFQFPSEMGITQERYQEIGYASAQLKTIYPNNKFLICNTTIEEESNKTEYQIKTIQKYEYNAFACADLFFQLANSIIQYLLNPQKYLQLFQKNADCSVILKMLFNRDCLLTISKVFNLKQIQKNYVFKIVNLTKTNYIFNSAQLCGKIINLLYENIKLVSLEEFKQDISHVIDHVFLLLQKQVVKLNFSDQGTLRLQNQDQNIVGTIKLTLMKCLWIFMENSKKFNSLNETVLHIITLWFFEYYQNTQYNVEFYKLFKVILKRGSHLCIVNLLIKINFLSSLTNAHQQICFNLNIDLPLVGIYCKYHKTNGQNLENMLLYIRKMVQSIKYGFNHNNLQILRPQIERLCSWNYLAALDGNNISLQLLTEQDGNMTSPHHNKKTESLDGQNINSKSYIVSRESRGSFGITSNTTSFRKLILPTIQQQVDKYIKVKNYIKTPTQK